MGLRLVQVNVKARDDSTLGRFWAEALGWTASGGGRGVTTVAPVGFDWTDPAAPVCLDVVTVPDPETVRCRVYLELAATSVADGAETVARLQRLGATGADLGQGDLPWTVLADPEGNRFWVREPGVAYPDTGPIAAIVVECAKPRVMARFWGDAMGWTARRVADDRVTLRSAAEVGPTLEFRRMPDEGTVRSRAHLDLVPQPGDTQASEIARLLALGAMPADVGQGDAPWTVLADPEGNHFCVLAPA